jgi:hypothetical protein
MKGNKTIKVIPVIIAVVLLALNANAQSFDFNPTCRRAYDNIIALRTYDGTQLLLLEKKDHPNNLIVVYLENYIDFLNLYINDTHQQYDALKDNKNKRLAVLEGGDKTSPYYLYTQAEVNVQWAVMSIKFGEYMNAIFEIKKAFKLLEDNQAKFPDFKANKKSLGLLYALLGSVPDKYKWGLNLLGLEGNLDKGISNLKEITDDKSDFIFRHETITLYAFLMLHLQNKGEQAWQLLKQNNFPARDNLMDVYTCAHIGVYSKHTDEAIEILNSRPNGPAYAAFPFLYYMTGLAKINRLDADADYSFKQYLASYKGDNYIKTACQKIAWSYLLKGDSMNYLHFMSKAENMGANMVDADKQALKEAQSYRVPNIALLRARLLCDGGYYERAEKEMQAKAEHDFKNVEEATEFYYRKARIYDEWGKESDAINYYQKAIDKGKTIPRYFAANSAFEMGKIYEDKGDKTKAKYYYNLCMSFQEHEYKNGLDQKAKAALNRLQ